MRLKPSKSLIGILAGVLLISLLAMGGAFWYYQDTTTKLNAQLDAKKRELDESKKVAARRAEAEAQLQKNRAELTHLELGVPPAEFMPTMLKDLERLARETDNRVEQVQPEPVALKPPPPPPKEGEKQVAPPEDPYVKQPVRISLVGTFTSMEEFINRLQQFPKIVAVDEIAIRPEQDSSGGKGNTGRLKVQLRLMTFMMKEEPAPAPPATPGTATPGTPNNQPRTTAVATRGGIL
jgi:Tfp pilus assembly protein PilO